ncbi:MAG: hypothetical protein M1828_006272 [Chrysothrix sp. TS-e1954]|nr:MAG: hypothetical protein M1828_006272 [Chrysothrix sp. TS-e1954]
MRGNCTNSDCRYAHIRVNAGAPVCRDFAILGFCSAGATCLERHVHECPDYANKALCRSRKCKLPHVDRAGQLRKATAVDDTLSESLETSDIDSNAGHTDANSDDLDSDDLEDTLCPASSPDQRQELSEQSDFVKIHE